MKITALLHLIGMSAALFLPIASARAQGLSLRCAPDKVVECDLGGPGTTPPGYLVLHNFSSDASDGQGPRSRLLEATDGVLYGTTVGGGTGGFGTVFRVNKDGSGYTVLRGFSIKDDEGRNPGGTLLEGTDGRLYGTTRFRGASSPGTVFAMNKDGGGYTNLHSFSASDGDGAQPLAGVVEGPDGRLYGTTSAGGTDGVGTIFNLNKDGTGYALLLSFAATGGDGQSPWAGLTASGDGWLYGTTVAGGPDNVGTAFKVRQDGSGYVILHGFASTGGDGRNPFANLIEGTDGWLYGSTRFGGGGGKGTVFRLSKDGTGYLRLREFSAIAGEGGEPWATGVAIDGQIYGIAYVGGVDAGALVFRMGRDGSNYTILRNLPGADIGGQHPFAGLTQGRDGALYGTMESGGTGEAGTVFRLPLPCPWQFDPPTVENACNDGTDVTLSVLGTVTNGVCPLRITRTWQATNSCGVVAVCSQTVTLVNTSSLAECPPLILRGLVSQVVGVGSNTTFTASIEGTPPFTFQWFKDELPIPGATGPTLNFAQATHADAGYYHFTVANSAGTATSHTILLRIQNAPTSGGPGGATDSDFGDLPSNYSACWRYSYYDATCTIQTFEQKVSSSVSVSYPTLKKDNGAQHYFMQDFIWLGSDVSGTHDGTPSPIARLDPLVITTYYSAHERDIHQEENGVRRVPVPDAIIPPTTDPRIARNNLFGTGCNMPGQEVYLAVEAYTDLGTAYLNAWIDYGDSTGSDGMPDGKFQPNEYVIVDQLLWGHDLLMSYTGVDSYPYDTTALASALFPPGIGEQPYAEFGLQLLKFTIPPMPNLPACGKTAFARFRISKHKMNLNLVPAQFDPAVPENYYHLLNSDNLPDPSVGLVDDGGEVEDYRFQITSDCGTGLFGSSSLCLALASKPSLTTQLDPAVTATGVDCVAQLGGVPAPLLLGFSADSNTSGCEFPVVAPIGWCGTGLMVVNVVNSGPANLSGVVVTYRVPTDGIFLGATASQGAVTQRPGEITFSLGVLAAGEVADIAVHVLPMGTTNLTHRFTTSADQPLLNGNTTVFENPVTVITPPVECPPNNTLKAVIVGTNLAVTWIGTGYRLESTTAFNDAPTVWTPVSNTSPVTLPASANQMFFRLVCP